MYYVTLTTQDRELLFGSISEGTMFLNAVGQIVEDEWLRAPSIRPEVSLDEYVIMPDHLHGIIVINWERNGATRRGVLQYALTRSNRDQSTPFRSPSATLGAIVRGFKGASTKRINTLRRTYGTRVWQRNYYEHIVRDGNDLDRIRAYFARNVEAWMERHEPRSKEGAEVQQIGPGPRL